MTFFSEKISIFTPKTSDHRPGFSDFPDLYCIKCRIRSFLHKKSHYFRTEFLYDTFFLLCSYFRAHLTILLLKILGGRMHGQSPTSNFGGTVPPVPLGLRPCPPVASITLTPYYAYSIL